MDFARFSPEVASLAMKQRAGARIAYIPHGGFLLPVLEGGANVRGLRNRAAD
jgi:hypothetical protein